MPSFILASLLFVTNPQDLTAHAQAVLASMAAQDFGAIEAQFDDTMKTALPPGRLATLWTGVQTQFGTFKSCRAADARVRAIADKQMVITPCEFEHAKVDLQLAFDPAGRISGFSLRPSATPAVPYAPPPYATPSSYVSSEVSVGTGEWTLPGTLTLPNAEAPVPAVVLVHGSGPNDRDETLGPNKPFADLAAGLASRGIAVLRFDKRTKVYGAKMAALTAMTVKEESIDDALAAVELLRANPKVDAKRIYVLGHSLGGTLIPRIAAAEPKLAGVIVMAGAARPIEDAIVEQTKYLANADGVVTPDEQKQIDEMTKTAAAIRTATAADAAAGKQIFHAPVSYWLDLNAYDPPAAAKSLTLPMLILQGERDYQVNMDDYERWKAALGAKPNVSFHVYPGLNHLFMAGTGKSLPAEYNQPSHVAEQVVADIAAWIKR